MEKLVEVKDLSVSYFTYAGTVQAVRGISFDIERNKTLAIVGESGCGKTVTAKTLLGLIKKPGKIADESQIIFEEQEILDFEKKQWLDFRGKECSMVFQDAMVSLNPTMKIGKQIIENLDSHKVAMSKSEKREKAVEMLRLVGISDPEQCLKRYPHELSGGMRQRVVIAMALITQPKLLVADEPTTALDVTIQAQIMELMKDLQKKMGMSIVLITHDLGIVADIADQVMVMYAGKIVEKGECRDIFYHPRHPYTWALLESVPKMYTKGKTILNTIEGNIPDMTNLPKGCAFCNRCPYAMNICKEYEPLKTICDKGHEVSCWLQDDRADITGIPYQVRGSIYEE